MRALKLQRSGIHLGVRYALGVLISIGNMFVLTWWIGPHAYGVFVTAIGLTTFLAGFTRNGIDTCLVRRAETPGRSQYESATALTLLFSLALLAIGVSLVPILRYWYHNAEFLGPYLVLLTTIPFVGVAGPATAKLDRELRFTTVAQIELGGQLLALILSLLLAWRGFGVWAPVIGQLAWQASGTVAAFICSGLKPCFRLHRKDCKEMLAFGAAYTASIRTWQLRTLVNPLIVGRLVGAEGVAFVGFAIRVAEGLGFIRVAASRLAIAGLARLQNKKDQLRDALESAQVVQVLVLGPLLCAFALVAPFFIPVALGARWMPSLQVFPFIAAAVLINSVFNLQASALFVLGEQSAVLKAFGLHVILLAGSTLFLVPRLGVLGYGWADLIACGGYVCLHSAIHAALGISYRKLVPWAIALSIPLFAPVVSRRWALILCLPVLLVATHWLRQQLHKRNRRAQQRLARISAHGRHLLTFVLKAWQRGPSYVVAVSIYTVRSLHYQVRTAILRRFPAIKVDRHVDLAESNVVDTRFHFRAEDIPRLVDRVSPALKQAVVAEADNICVNRFAFRGMVLQFAGAIDWNARPGNSRSWQWDLNRHRFFLTLGTAYYYSGRCEYLAKLIDLWTDWIAQNAVVNSPAWNDPFEVATRLRNWIFAYFLLDRSGTLQQLHRRTFLTAIQAHADYVCAHLEYHWPNNHLLLEAKTLLEVALALPHYPNSPGWYRRALKILRREILTQILPDGGHSEGSSMYHRIISGELQQLALLCQKTGRPLSAAIEERITKSIKFSAAMLREDGSTPLLSDSATGDTNLRFDFARPTASDLTYWVQHSPQARAVSVLPGQPELRVFPDTGYAFARCAGPQDFHLTFDFGAFSRCIAPNHGHADALSFELHAHGSPLIIDPGTCFPANNDPHWTRYFRSTAAHNTLVIDGKEQSQFSHYTDLRRAAATQLLHYGVSGNRLTMTAQCIPYWVNGSGVRHVRRIDFIPDRPIQIVDAVSGSGIHQLEWFFHFAPKLEVCEQSSHTVSVCTADTHISMLSLRAENLPFLNLSLKRGENNPICGWVSSNSAQVQPAYVAVFAARVNLPISITFELDLAA